MIRTIIIDDEPSAVNVLATLLKKKCKEDVEVLATSHSPLEGIDLIKKYQPDLVFLDIEMPGMTGIELLHHFPNPRFHVIFVTAHGDYALEAFQLCALDYILKPIGPESVTKTIAKVKNDIIKRQGIISGPIQKLERLLTRHAKNGDAKIGIAMADKIIFVQTRDIVYCEASSAYTNIHLMDGRKMVASKPLGYFEVLLSNFRFFRIHHSCLINLNKIKEFQRCDGGCVIMDNNKQLEVSRRKRNEFLEAIDDFVV